MNEKLADKAEQTRRRVRLIRAASVASVSVALALVAVKVWAWIQTGSIALLGSLADSLLDLLASAMTLIAVRYALEPADREHRFGHGKLEAIAGLVQSLIIIGSASYVGYEAVNRFLSPEPVAAPLVGVIVMLLSLALTISLVLFQRFVVKQTGSVAISADALHYKGDVLTNVAVLVAIGASSWLGWHLADPVLGLLVAAVILASARMIVLQALDILLDRELPTDLRREIAGIAKGHQEVLGIHDLRTRSSGASEFIQFHLELKPELTLTQAHEICDEVESELLARFPQAEIIIHADPYGLDEPQDDF